MFARLLLVANLGFATLVLLTLNGRFVGAFVRVGWGVCGRLRITFFAWATVGALATAFAAVTAVAVA